MSFVADALPLENAGNHAGEPSAFRLESPRFERLDFASSAGHGGAPSNAKSAGPACVGAILVEIPRRFPPRTPEQVALQRAYARLALGECARLCEAPREGWTKNEQEVPQPNDGWCWSISHKRRFAVAAIAREPIGIDIEEIVPHRNADLFAALASDDEWHILGDRSWRSFYTLWTAKEAVLKANELGIGELLICRAQRRTGRNGLVLSCGAMGWAVECDAGDDRVVAVARANGATGGP